MLLCLRCEPAFYFVLKQQRHHGPVPSNSPGVPSPSASPGARRTPPHDMSKQGVRHSGQQPMSVGHQQTVLLPQYRMQPQTGQMHQMVSCRSCSKRSKVLCPEGARFYVLVEKSVSPWPKSSLCCCFEFSPQMRGYHMKTFLYCFLLVRIPNVTELFSAVVNEGRMYFLFS